MRDPEIERLEDDLRNSQFRAWEAEEFLAKRRDEKAAPDRQSAISRYWPDVIESLDIICLLVGRAAIIALLGLGLLLA